VLWGKQGDAEIRVDEVAAWAETISYELLTTVGRRIPRVYVVSTAGRRFHAIEPGCAGQQRARTVSTLAAVLVTSLKSTSTYEGLYGTDTWALDPRTYWTVSGRFNRATIDLKDQLGTALNGHHAYTRFNPASGLTFNPWSTLTAYAAYNEGMRAPTAVELTCADPNAPCSLPNAFASDPELKPVISRTYELGSVVTPTAEVARVRLRHRAER